MSDERRIECAAKRLAFADGTTDAEVARKFLTELDAVDPLRQTRGDAVEAAYQAYEEFMSIDHSLNECTTKEILTLAPSRALNAAMAVMGRAEAPDPPFPAWSPEMAALVRFLADRMLQTSRSNHWYDKERLAYAGLYSAAFPDPAREGRPMSNNPPALHPHIAKSRILRPEGLAPSARCPSCTKRAAFHDYLGVMDTFEQNVVVEWQCIYCGSIVDRGVGGKPVWTGVIDNIILRPGELEELRHARGK